MSVLLEFSMFPLDKGESLSGEVGRLLQLIRESGLPYRLTAMGTIIETKDLKTALGLVEQAYTVLSERGSQRVYAAMKVDIRDNKEGRLTGKIDSIEARIGRVSK